MEDLSNSCVTKHGVAVPSACDTNQLSHRCAAARCTCHSFFHHLIRKIDHFARGLSPFPGFSFKGGSRHPTWHIFQERQVIHEIGSKYTSLTEAKKSTISDRNILVPFFGYLMSICDIQDDCCRSSVGQMLEENFVSTQPGRLPSNVIAEIFRTG
jgi:hypothetical protein